MPSSTLSVFSDPDDFQTALKEGGCVDLIVTGQGKFRAHLSQITLHRMRLAAGEERKSRVAFISIPHDLVRVTLPMGPPGSLVSTGIPTRPDEIVTHSTGHRFHERTNNSCRWGAMWVLTSDLTAYAHGMSGAGFALLPGEYRWQPPRRALRSLIDLHRDAMRATAAYPHLPTDNQAARGLEQQLLGALMECLAAAPVNQGNLTTRRHAEIMIQFEDAIRISPTVTPSLAGMSAALGVSESTLRICCNAHLGVTPSRYLYLRRMRLVNQALREAGDAETSVAQIARLHGFNGRSDFLKAYRTLFGELPAATLRRLAAP